MFKPLDNSGLNILYMEKRNLHHGYYSIASESVFFALRFLIIDTNNGIDIMPVSILATEFPVLCRLEDVHERFSVANLTQSFRLKTSRIDGINEYEIVLCDCFGQLIDNEQIAV